VQERQSTLIIGQNRLRFHAPTCLLPYAKHTLTCIYAEVLKHCFRAELVLDPICTCCPTAYSLNICPITPAVHPETDTGKDCIWPLHLGQVGAGPPHIHLSPPN